MQQPLVRPIREDDYAQWRVLWDGYNAFYGRAGLTSLNEGISKQTWARFFDPAEPMHAFVAEIDGQVVGLVHCVFHRSTTRMADVCYLQDLFTDATRRGRGVGRALIQRVVELAKGAGSSRVYWTTQLGNVAGRALYDKVAEYRDFIVYSKEL